MPVKPRLKGMDLTTVPEGVSHLAVSVFRLSRILKAQVSRVVSRSESLGLVAWRILMGLSLVPDATQRELVEFTRMEQAQISRALKEMEAKGLIRSARSETDGRVRLFSITEAGRARHADLLPGVGQLSQAIDAALSPDETTQFLQMCMRIEAAAQAGLPAAQTAKPNNVPEEV